MHRSLRIAVLGFALGVAPATAQVTPKAQEQSAAAKPSFKSLGMIIYPAKQQTPEQQAADEEACAIWAENQTGLELSGGSAVNVDSAAQASGAAAAEATTGAAVAGAARGAAGGAIIGGITGDAGEGAAIGAVAGAIGGRRAKKQAEAQAAAQGAQQAQAMNQAATDHYKKAATVCLEGRGYTVK